jgi:hypothetical protein
MQRGRAAPRQSRSNKELAISNTSGGGVFWPILGYFGQFFGDGEVKKKLRAELITSKYARTRSTQARSS